MTTLEEYTTEICPVIASAILSAFPTVIDHLRESIKKSAEDNVYSYPAGEDCDEERRFALGAPENLPAETGEFYVAIKNITEMQFDAGPPEVDVIELGLEKYMQETGPGPRPFMDEARDNYVEQDGENDLADALRAAGFEVRQGG